MSVCTWATVVSTVPSQSVNGAENASPLQIFGNVDDAGEPMPLPTFLSFLELLEEGNGEERHRTCANDKLNCPEDLNDTPLMTDGNYNFKDFDVFDLDINADGLLNDDINSMVINWEGSYLFDCAAAPVISDLQNGACCSSTSEWISEGLFSLSSSDYNIAATEAYDNVNMQYANSEAVKPIVIEKGLYDWSPDLFDQITATDETIIGVEACEQQNDACLASCTQRKRYLLELLDLPESSSGPQSGAKHRRKRKRVNDLQHQESQSCNLHGTRCRETSTTRVIEELCM